MTLKIVQSIKSNFDKNSTYKVYYTRLSDWYPSLSYRYKMANEVSADRFLSVISIQATLHLPKEPKPYTKLINPTHRHYSLLL
ncbi:MAG: hypothetical protein ACLVI9_07470 [Anaerostipes hadrus]